MREWEFTTIQATGCYGRIPRTVEFYFATRRGASGVARCIHVADNWLAVRMGCGLPDGTRLALRSPELRLDLKVEVIWCRQTSDGLTFTVGLRPVKNSATTGADLAQAIMASTETRCVSDYDNEAQHWQRWIGGTCEKDMSLSPTPLAY